MTPVTTRADLEALVWRHWPSRGTLARQSVDAVLAAADAYAQTQVSAAAARRRRKLQPPPARPVLRHTSDTDLWPVIRVLADALMPSSEQEAAA